jgi:hypothetical protein
MHITIKYTAVCFILNSYYEHLPNIPFFLDNRNQKPDKFL